MVAYMSKTVVLTSGTSGIGKAIAKKLLSESKEEKDHIFINYGHNDQVAQMFYKELTKEDKKKVTFIKADLSTYEGMEQLLHKIKKKRKTVDWLILNTGISSYLPFEEYTYELWEHIFRTNVSVPLFLVKELKTMMKEHGCIFFMGSHAGQEPYSSSLVYSVSKAAVLFMAKSLVKVFEEKVVRVNAVAPGFIETKWQENRTEKSREIINAKIALHRFGTSEEVAQLCYHILVNGYLNGAIFDIHGGYNYF